MVTMHKSAVASERWVAPFKVSALLNSCLNKLHDDHPMSVGYEKSMAPTSMVKSNPLYIGGITGQSHRFRTRIGDLLADAFGFYNENNRKLVIIQEVGTSTHGV